MQQAPVTPIKKGMAIASLILGIVSIPTCGVIVIGSLVGIILGIIAINNANKKPQQYGGKGMAIGGIVTSVLGLLLIAVNAAVAIPQLQKSLKVGRETVVITSLNSIHQAEAAYYSSKNKYGTLHDLAEAQLLRKNIATEKTVAGYLLSESEITEKTYCMHATRESAGSGNRDFNITESGVINYLEGRTPIIVPRGEGTPMTGAESQSGK